MCRYKFSRIVESTRALETVAKEDVCISVGPWDPWHMHHMLEP